ncbi:MAG: hypothetical protein L7R83_02690 [Candidatus Poseidonia sp.]|nr:hypothetical protein [Poseidonia sp.]
MSEDARGLDHLMEQNETELDFLSAYGGVDDGQKGDGHALLAALQRFLRAGGLETHPTDSTLDFAWGSARAEEDGCRLVVTGEHLPLVESDLMVAGFSDGHLNRERSEVSVLLTAWSMEQRRFIERLVEHQSKD